VRSERNLLVDSETTYADNVWVTKLYYAFQDKNYLYLIMEVQYDVIMIPLLGSLCLVEI
jgi:hypothetical protein